jgi:hypothetical protein
MWSFRDEITVSINRCRAENGSDTPDFILAQYLVDCLRAFDGAVMARERWYGREKQPACTSCTCGEEISANKGEVPLPHKTTCPRSDTSC